MVILLLVGDSSISFVMGRWYEESWWWWCVSLVHEMGRCSRSLGGIFRATLASSAAMYSTLPWRQFNSGAKANPIEEGRDQYEQHGVPHM